MYSSIKKTRLLLLGFILFIPIAFAEPMPDILYVNDINGECGYAWGGDEYAQYEPSGDEWEDVAFVGFWNESSCKAIADRIADIGTQDACTFLEENYKITGTDDPEQICEIMGYNYTGELEVFSKNEMPIDYGKSEITSCWKYFIGVFAGILLIVFLIAKFYKPSKSSL